ncbi:hypothetical protein EBBID32_22020 [Sphingobium indicum BiD32]|uniref:Uncharacterized protein n=1 Tax=Sphingobium indicum BiD32 TaxID=1301087 RepID=N1MQZ5_9SPHN|nr:hypothetical protein EBBID32_22020 [Sphingobium indicum BiD32]
MGSDKSPIYAPAIKEMGFMFRRAHVVMCQSHGREAQL